MSLYSENKELLILRNAVENTNEAFVTINEEHEVIFFNKAAEKIFGYSRDEVVGRDLDVIMAPGCSRNHHRAVRHFVRTRSPGRIGHEAEMLANRKNGDTFPANISFSVADVEGKLYFTGIVKDLSETRALEERIAQSERLAALGHVVAEITHEIKNPLMMIGGFANQLSRLSLDEKSRSKLRIITEEVSRLEKLLGELSSYYKPALLKKEKVDVNGLIREVLYLLRHDLEKHCVNVEFLNSDEPVFFEGDRDKMKQVFLNLTQNAIAAMESGGRLNIETRVEQERMEIIIADDGCGIPQRDMGKIFSPFFTTKKHGTGLGLSISKKIIEAHTGGSFTLFSEEGKGTIFKISMPVVDEHDPPERRSRE